jgi:Carboxypeptidase regulatory-like domain
MRNYRLIVVGLLIFLVVGVAWGQDTMGTISGTVKDSSDAEIASATVVILNDDTGISGTVASDDGGRYSAPSLSLGQYSVTGSHEGFQSEVRRGIVLTVGREAIVESSLTVGATTQ